MCWVTMLGKWLWERCWGGHVAAVTVGDLLDENIWEGMLGNVLGFVLGEAVRGDVLGEDIEEVVLGEVSGDHVAVSSGRSATRNLLSEKLLGEAAPGCAG